MRQRLNVVKLRAENWKISNAAGVERKRMHTDKLSALIELRNKRVIDIGAGDGDTAQKIAARGAYVTGIEISPEKVAVAQAKAVANTCFLLGRAEALPVSDASQDLACFFFSLHHIPLDVQKAAFAEVRRVVKPGGRMHVADPLPYGTMTEVLKAVDDETYMRTESQAHLDQLAQTASGFSLVTREEYAIVRRFSDFAALVRRTVAVDPTRLARLAEVQGELERRFRELAVWEGDHFTLLQPCVMYHFEL